jgi:hypothetical protein
VVSSEFTPELEWSDIPRRTAHALAIENSKEDGGSLTPQSHIGQINELYLYGSRLSSKQGERFALFPVEDWEPLELEDELLSDI